MTFDRKRMLNVAAWELGSRAYTSSTAYGYSPAKINDGITTPSPRDRDTAWRSAAEELPQWAAISFVKRVRIEGVIIHWGRNIIHSTSRTMTLETWVDGRWVPLASVQRKRPEPKTEIQIDSRECHGLRVYQGVGCGPRLAPNVLHITELEVYGVFVGSDSIPHAVIRDSLLEEWEENFWRARGSVTREVLTTIDKKSCAVQARDIVDETAVERARWNRQHTRWGRQLCAKLLMDANWWLDKDEEYIYQLIPPENPRALAPSYEKGCPIHGGGHGCMATNTALKNAWKCHLGGEWWYDGIRAANPATGKLIEIRDDGDGWVAPVGFRNPGTIYHFKAAWRYYALSKLFFKPGELTLTEDEAYTGDTAVIQLALAYALTGDDRYAHRAAVMLNRLAEVYRTFNGTVDEQRPLTRGYLTQVSFEEIVIHNCLVAYHLIRKSMFKDRALLDFFHSKGDCDYNGDGRIDADDLKYNIQHNLFGYMYEWLHRVMPIQSGDYVVREGLVLAALGCALGNNKLINEAINGLHGLAVNLTNNTFRDGKWWYDSTGYAVESVTRNLLHRLFSLIGLKLVSDQRLRLPQLIDFSKNVDCDGRLPGVGDTTEAKYGEKVLHPYRRCSIEDLAYLHTRDPDHLADLLHFSGGNADRIRNHYMNWELLFHATPIRGKAGPVVPRTKIFHDSGFAILRTGLDMNTRQHVVLNYGKGNAGHGHRDKLALNIIAYGRDLTADVGYLKNISEKKADDWAKHTASHATVAINGLNQQFATGSLQFYGRTPGTQLISATAEAAYPDLAQRYERTLSLIDVSGSQAYVFDVFTVTGGEIHDYLFHGPNSAPSGFELNIANGAEAMPTNKGTLAGPDVPFGDLPGYGYLTEIAKAAHEGEWSATWRVEDESLAGIKLTMLGAIDREIITGKGEAQGFLGQSPWNSYVVARSKAGASMTIFAAVLEPFCGDPVIETVAPLEVINGVGAKIVLDERTDYLFRRTEGASSCKAWIGGDVMEHDGEFARVTLHASGRREMHLVKGAFLRFGAATLTAPPTPRGTLESIDLPKKTVVLSCERAFHVAPGDLIIFRNPRYICHSSYEIRNVSETGAHRYSVELNMGLDLAQGIVQSTQLNQDVFETDTRLTKLWACKGLANGKAVYIHGIYRGSIDTYLSSRFKLARPHDLHLMKAGDKFIISDLSPGDSFEILRTAYREL